MTGNRALLGEPGGIQVPLARWRPCIPPEAWPAALPGDGTLWRADIFGAANDWRAGRLSARAFLVAACMWGYGPVGYGPARVRAVLQDDPDGSSLESNLEPLRHDCPATGDLRAAYQRFNRASGTRLRGLGPAFFTKLLYFAGYRRGAGGIQPLILDRNVAACLPADAGAAAGLSWGWPSDQWMAYLTWAARQARRPGFGGEPDRVEMALFTGTWTPG
jgi:hypothetical protein